MLFFIAYSYIIANKGIDTSAGYPYEAIVSALFV